MQIAVIGAGLAGLAAATDLIAAGHEVVVWEKSRGPGGRAATRRGPGDLRFDHGAPFLHDGDAPLSGLPELAPYEIRLPDGAAQAHIVGAESGNAPAKALAAGLDVRPGIRIGAVAAVGAGWRLSDEDGAAVATADALIVTAPAPQTAELLADAAPALAARAATVAFDPCWAAMAAWDQPLELPFTAATGSYGLSWAVADGPKPRHAPGERWVLQADADWSAEHLEAEPADVGPLLLSAFASLAGHALPPPTHLVAHRWRYSRPRTPSAEPFLIAGTLLAAGDWCGGDTAGAAVRSGRAAAAALIAQSV